jgi:hypothetical protein
MKMKNYLAGAALLIATSCVAQAQQETEWKQVLNMPKGQSMPREGAEILGIELGDSYAEAKAKLEKLGTESAPQNRSGSPLKETSLTFRLQPQGASQVTALSFVSVILLGRTMPGVSRPYEDNLQVYFSAPSSGHQVKGIERSISYNAEGDQPRVSEIIGRLKEKMKVEPQFYESRETAEYVFQFNDGKAFTPPRTPVNECHAAFEVKDSASISSINPKGICDAVMIVKVNFGISRDHAKYILFRLGDNERTKANLTADFGFIREYVRALQERSKGAPPKL